MSGGMVGAYMTPEEYGAWLAQQEPPITDEQAEAAARILATVEDSHYLHT